MNAPDLFRDHKPPLWREQDAIAARVVHARSRDEKHQIVRSLCHSLARMTDKRRYRL
ncbi:hypothetical protein [Paraburkholderia sp. SOS3]|uniref:hypothetical protein n=1 Tax=Paraburkholderia sp. SOS3 TaxID=1926494 RepID=UPI0012EB1BBE|nr:hypothetical protein [Paraburkholderia sp. SOS3]